MEELGRAVLDMLRHRLVNDYPAQVRACLDALNDEQVWWRPNPQANSVGNLLLHVCGSTRHFVGRGVGGSGYARNRPGEFAEKGPIPREELRRTLDETVSETQGVLDALAPSRLLELSERLDKPFTVLNLLLRTSHHWAVHTGQMVYVTKSLKEGVFDDLAMKTAR
jgi:uncharacterized damage-inducible protein DinB